MIIHSSDYSKDFLNKLTIIEEEILIEEEEFIFESLSVLLNEGIIGNLTRNSMDSLKKFFKSFIAAIQGIFKKFMENVTHLFKSGDKWLEDNKDYFFNADVTNFKRSVLPYWEKAGVAQKIDNSLPRLNQQILDKIDELQYNEEEFRQYCISLLGLKGEKIRPDKDNFEEDLKVVLRGNGSKIIVGAEIKKYIKPMYEYCKDYSNEYKKVIKLKNDIISACNQAINKINQARPAEDPNQNKENSVQHESVLFENVIFLEELQGNKNDKGASDFAKDRGRATNPSEVNAENKEINDKENKNDTNNTKTDNSDFNEYDGRDKDDLSKLIKAYTIYSKTYQKFLTVRITIMEEKYKSYMKTLREIARLGMGQSDDTKYEGQSANNYERERSKNKVKDGLKDVFEGTTEQIKEKATNLKNKAKNGAVKTVKKTVKGTAKAVFKKSKRIK